MYVNNYKGKFPRPGVGRGAFLPEDWIYYEDNASLNRRMDDCPLAKFLGTPVNREVYRCPSDDVNVRRDAAAAQYPYSYSVNYLICRLGPPNWSGATYTPVWGPGATNETMSISQVANASDKILLIDETAETVDDGCWAWMGDLGQGFNVLSTRHMRKQEQIQFKNDHRAGWGNVLFVDGHSGRIERKASFDRRNYDPLFKM